MDCLAFEVTNLSLDKRLFSMPCILRESSSTQIHDRLAGIDHLHVVVVRLLPDAPEVGRQDDVVLALGWSDVHREHDEVRVLRQRVVDDLLRVRLGGDGRIERILLDQAAGT